MPVKKLTETVSTDLESSKAVLDKILALVKLIADHITNGDAAAPPPPAAKPITPVDGEEVPAAADAKAKKPKTDTVPEPATAAVAADAAAAA